MAAPTYRSGTQPVLSDAGTVTSPADTVIGDLVVIFLWSQGTNIPTHTIQGGYTQIRSHSHNDGTTDGRLSVAYRVATSAGAQAYTPYTISGATAGQTCVGCIVITTDTYSLLASFPQNSSTLTTSGVPNPPSIGPATGYPLYGDYLVLAIAAWHVTTAGSTTTTQPTNYTERLDAPTGSHVTHLAVATRALTGLSNSTEDPGAFADNVTPNGSVSMTIGIGMIIGGTFSKTLDALGDSTDSDVLIVGATSKTLDTILLSADGSQSATEAIGTLNVTLGSLGLSATGAASVTGSLSRTLDGLSRNTDADAIVSAASAVTLADLGLSSGGILPIVASAIPTFGSLGISATGQVQDPIVAGTLDQALAALSLSAQGTVAVVGAADVSLGLALSAAAALPVVGTTAPTLGALSLSAGGVVTVDILGSLSVQLGNLLSSAAASAIVGGSASLTLSESKASKKRTYPYGH